MSDKNIIVDQGACIGCTLCTQICPKVFEMMDNGKAKAVSQEGCTEKKLQQAIDSCPVQCIELKESSKKE